MRLGVLKWSALMFYHVKYFYIPFICFIIRSEISDLTCNSFFVPCLLHSCIEAILVS